jgi:hypothetical protein
VSVEVAGETAKPALGSDGTRIPLLRQGFRPQGPYLVSFVYLHSTAPLQRKGDLSMTLPRMDIPVSLVEWEIFVPERFKVRPFGGNAIERVKFGEIPAVEVVTVSAPASPSGVGTISGRVTDTSGGVMPGVTVTLAGPPLGNARRTATTDATGTYTIPGLPGGTYVLTMQLAGFSDMSREIALARGANVNANGRLRVGELGETVAVTVQGEAPVVSVANASQQSRMILESAETRQMPSQNVINLQRRAAGVLPVRMDVPRAGTSHQFVRLLAVDQETSVSLRYQRR